jgi:hypothetical protein
MSTFYKVYNTLDNYWKRVIYKLSKDSTVLESYGGDEIKYKPPIGLISTNISKRMINHE